MTFDPSPYIEGLKRANEKEKAAIEERARRAREEARRVATRIGQSDTEVKRIYLFGSLAGEGPTHLEFDIDLACEGGDLYAALDIAEASEFSIDLLELRLLPQHIRERVEREGVVLFER